MNQILPTCFNEEQVRIEICQNIEKKGLSSLDKPKFNMKMSTEKLEMRLFDIEKSILEIRKENNILKQELIILNEKLEYHRNTILITKDK